jgi:hypothetical protein
MVELSVGGRPTVECANLRPDSAGSMAILGTETAGKLK